MGEKEENIYDNIMAEDPEELSLYDKLIEPNRFRIVKYFDPYVVFDIMRSEGVFTMDDQERVQNMYPPTRRARAGQFLDILQTKGDKGVQIYINVLEYDYPHVYKLITNKDAKEPPRGFKQHRESLRSKWIDRLGEFVEAIKNQCADNNALKEQLEDVKAVVNLNQENIQASENENNLLREQVRLISDELKNLKEQCNTLLRERDRLKDDNLKIQKDCLEYFKEKDHYKDKFNSLQYDKEQLELTNKKLHDEILVHQLKKLTVDSSQYRMSVREEKAEQIQSKLREITVEKNTLERIEMEKGILKDELAEAQIKAEELAEDMDNLRVELDRCQGECQKLKEKLEKEKREKALVETWLQEKNKKIENYFERIRELENDKENLEGERNREQQKNKELDHKYSKLFNEKHQQEQMLDVLKLEVQDLKLQLRKSGELPPEPLCPGPLPTSIPGQTSSNKSSESSDDLSEHIVLETARELLPWKIEDYACRPLSGTVIYRSGSVDESRDKWTVRMKMPILDRITICGGNFTGIFVDKVIRKTDVPKPGDKIESVCRINAENYSREDLTLFEGFTQSQARDKLSNKHSTDDMEVTFRRMKINNIPEFDCVTKWMQDTSKNSKRGDYFYVRTNTQCNTCTLDVPEKSPKHKMQTGDVFLVQDTCPGSTGEWQALKFDKKRKDWGPLCQSIPDSSQNRRHVMHRQPSAENVPSRKMAFRQRNLYTNVFPMKATSMLPVWMVGPQDVVLAVQDLMCKYHPTVYVTATTCNLTQVMNTVKNQKKHVLVHINTQSWADKIGILLLFNVQAKDPGKLSLIVNKQVTPDVLAINIDVLKQQGLDLEEITIPSDEVKSEETLVQTVHKKISELQRRVLWLCESRLKKYKPEILKEYKCFFTENNIVMLYPKYSSSQDEQSNTGNENQLNVGQDTSSGSVQDDQVISRQDDTIRTNREQEKICNSLAENEC